MKFKTFLESQTELPDEDLDTIANMMSDRVGDKTQQPFNIQALFISPDRSMIVGEYQGAASWNRARVVYAVLDLKEFVKSDGRLDKSAAWNDVEVTNQKPSFMNDPASKLSPTNKLYKDEA